MYDVVVVGAGVVGCHTASRLANWGHKVLVVEKHHNIGKVSCCTGILGKECVESFPIPPALLLRKASAAKFSPPSGNSVRIAQETAQAYIVDRVSLDQSLATAAQQKGVEFLLGSRAEQIIPKEDCLQVTVSHQEKETILEGKTLVLACGFGSGISQSLGLGKSADFALGAQAEVETSGVEEVEVYLGQEIAPGFFAWLVPTYPGKALAGLLCRHHPGFYLQNFLALLRDQGKITALSAEIRYGAIPLRPLSKTYGERFIVIGDAAGQVKPTTGGGIYYGLLCAEIGAEVIHQALIQEDFSERRLAQYQRGWRRKLATELRIGYYARRIYEGLNDRQIEAIFHLVQSNGIHQALLKSPDFSFDWHSTLILKALKHHALRGVVEMLKTSKPFSLFR